jgi:hypothetical protein
MEHRSIKCCSVFYAASHRMCDSSSVGKVTLPAGQKIKLCVRVGVVLPEVTRGRLFYAENVKIFAKVQ